MHKWKMPGTEKLQNYKEGDGIKDEEYAGYYCLVLAIVCGLNAAEAWKIYQYGPIILQKAVEVQQGDTPEVLQRRVMEEAEWKILPKAIDLIANNRVSVQNGKVVID